MKNEPLKPPFPWFGGKSRVSHIVWDRFGKVSNYVEPFFGSGAVLFNRPMPFDGIETVNDKDGFLANFWRAVQADPASVAKWVDNPVNENDLHARHQWLVDLREEFTERLTADPHYFDAKIAGWWVWGLCCWIGGHWCEARKVKQQLPHLGDTGQGVHRKLPHLGSAGQGVHRQLPHLGNTGQGVHRQLPHLGNTGQGVHRKRPHLGNTGQGVHRKLPHLGNTGQGHLLDYFTAIAQRLRKVRVCSGDWSRVCGPSPTVKNGVTAVFLDPPYCSEDRENVYIEESFTVAKEVESWCLESGENPGLRIALCGYEEDYPDLSHWSQVNWRAPGGYANQSNGQGRKNKHKEVILFSPYCLDARQKRLF